MHIEKGEPILHGLQSKSAQHQTDAERSKTPLREIVRVVFDVRIESYAQACNDASHAVYQG